MTEIEQLKAQLKEANDKAANEANAALALQSQLAKAKEENEALLKQQNAKVYVKVHLEKGTVSVYGINAQFPISAYPEGWAKVFSMKAEIERACQRPDVVAAALASKAAKVAARNAKKIGTPAAQS